MKSNARIHRIPNSASLLAPDAWSVDASRNRQLAWLCTYVGIQRERETQCPTSPVVFMRRKETVHTSGFIDFFIYG